MASLQDPSPAYKVAPTHVPILVPPTNGFAEVLRRQIILLDNLRTDLGTVHIMKDLSIIEGNIAISEDMMKDIRGSRYICYLVQSLLDISELNVRRSTEKEESPHCK